MDEATSRPRSASRRMASTRGALPTRRTSSDKPSGTSQDTDVSPARWAGVAFVIAAILAAVVLAVLSPSGSERDRAVVIEEPSPSPSPTVLDTRVPVAQPLITNPTEGVTPEVEIPVTVELPEEELPRRLLTLFILRGEDIIGELDTPKPGGAVKVEGVRLQEGPNELTAVVSGPGGFGPRSEPVTVMVDRDAPDLAITAPRDKYETYDDQARVEGTSEVGAEVVVLNEANEFEQPIVVGNSGEFGITVRLKRGVNRIVAISEDDAGVEQRAKVRIVRSDGRPTIKRIKLPEAIRRSELPAATRIVVDVVDAKGRSMEGATVSFTLGAPDRISQDATEVTNASGRAVWRPEIEASSSTADELLLGVTVSSALSNDTTTERRTIPFR